MPATETDSPPIALEHYAFVTEAQLIDDATAALATFAERPGRA